MPFTSRPYRRFPVQCSVTYSNAGPFLMLPVASCWVWGHDLISLFPAPCLF